MMPYTKKEKLVKKECPHKFTYTKDDLFSANSILSKKRCELCGETIVLDRKYKTYVIMFVVLLVVALMLIPYILKSFIPEISYTAKGLMAVMLFVIVYALGVYKIMNKATYKTYEPPTRVGEESFEKSRTKAEEKVYKALKKSKDQKNPTL